MVGYTEVIQKRGYGKRETSFLPYRHSFENWPPTKLGPADASSAAESWR
jgi:hypothetical protein